MGEFNPWDLLKLPTEPPGGPRPLDPPEELLRRDGIEVLPQDRQPQAPEKPQGRAPAVGLSKPARRRDGA